MKDSKTTIFTGSEALARGALEAGVQFVTGYPGSPATATVNALLRLAGDDIRIEWAINEKSAFDAAFGASLAGMRSLLCLKSVGLNVALDSLMVSNLAPGDGGFVLLIGDDPGGWGSQNEEDSRPIIAAAEIPLLEPKSANDGCNLMGFAFDLSERHQVPIALRVTRAMAMETVELDPSPADRRSPRPARFERQGDRFNVLPVHVVDYHQRLQAKLRRMRFEFECPARNEEEGQGQAAIIAAGYAYQKLSSVLGQSNQPPVRVLGLDTLHPLPVTKIATFLEKGEAALVLEETAPYLETEVQAIAQRAGLSLPIHGRRSGHIPGTGELFAHEIAQALTELLPAWPWPSFLPEGRSRPSRQPLCENCPYVPAVESLLAIMERHGGRDGFVVAGETGCMVRTQLPPWRLLDLKYGMGSSIGLAAGLVRAGIPQRVVALSGDSALLHSGLGELIDTVQAGVKLLIIVLANETTALSGGQPHPGTARDARGRARQPADLVALIQATGVASVRLVDPKQVQVTQAAMEEGLAADGVAVVIAARACPLWAGETTA
jgi:indolepyruvate ferredoxin oxidoreductase alpha subunit